LLPLWSGPEADIDYRPHEFMSLFLVLGAVVFKLEANYTSLWSSETCRRIKIRLAPPQMADEKKLDDQVKSGWFCLRGSSHLNP